MFSLSLERERVGQIISTPTHQTTYVLTGDELRGDVLAIDIVVVDDDVRCMHTSCLFYFFCDGIFTNQEKKKIPYLDGEMALMFI